MSTRAPDEPGIADPLAEDPLAFLYEAAEEDEEEAEHPGYASLLGMTSRTARKTPVLVLDVAEAQRAAEVMEINAGQLMTNPGRVQRHGGFLGLDPLGAADDEGEDEEELAETLASPQPDAEDDDPDWRPVNPLAGTGLEEGIVREEAAPFASPQPQPPEDDPDDLFGDSPDRQPGAHAATGRFEEFEEPQPETPSAAETEIAGEPAAGPQPEWPASAEEAQGDAAGNAAEPAWLPPTRDGDAPGAPEAPGEPAGAQAAEWPAPFAEEAAEAVPGDMEPSFAIPAGPGQIEIVRFPAPPVIEAPHHSLRARVMKSQDLRPQRPSLAGAAWEALRRFLRGIAWPHLRRLLAWARAEWARHGYAPPRD